MRCPACGARNSDDAAWCTQCYHRFAAAPPLDQEPAPSQPPPPPPQRDVRQRDGAVEWRCGACASWTPLEGSTCRACGSPRTGFGPDPVPRPLVPDAPVLLLSALAPGLGHVVAGRVGAGVARLGLALLWLGGGIAIVVAADSLVAALPGVVLLAGVAALWLGTFLDARVVAEGGRRELLDGRALLWLVVAVTVALIAALFAAATRAASAA